MSLYHFFQLNTVDDSSDFVTLEEYPPHSPPHALLMVHRVEHVDELVQVVGGFHDGAQEGDQGHVVALRVELGPEPVRLEDRKPVAEGPHLPHHLVVVFELAPLDRLDVLQHQPHPASQHLDGGVLGLTIKVYDAP